MAIREQAASVHPAMANNKCLWKGVWSGTSIMWLSHQHALSASSDFCPGVFSGQTDIIGYIPTYCLVTQHIVK